ncbi:MAG TPA: transposase, partial [Mycobacterium sp.]|nr:transposase [Mycobacterium sp.]
IPNGRKTLRFKVQRKALDDWLATQQGLSAELARDELSDVSRLSEAIAQLEKRINALVAVAAPALLALPGCAELTAAKIISETAGIGRFRSEAAFARLCGVAPIPSWSVNSGQLRAKKYGSRQLNMALHTIAATQIRLDGAGREYYQKRRDAGDKPSKATRALKRRLARVVYNRLRSTIPRSQSRCKRLPNLLLIHECDFGGCELTGCRLQSSRVSNAQVTINRPSEPSRPVPPHRDSCGAFRSQIRSQHPGRRRPDPNQPCQGGPLSSHIPHMLNTMSTDYALGRRSRKRISQAMPNSLILR